MNSENKTEATPSRCYWWQENAASGCEMATPKPGQPCPNCGQGNLAYDSLFLLTCPACGKVAEGGAFT